MVRNWTQQFPIRNALHFFGSWSDLDPFLESWNGSGMDRLIQDKNQFSSSSYDNIFCKNSSSDSIFFSIGSHVFGRRRFKLGDPAFQKQARLNANIKKKLLSKYWCDSVCHCYFSNKLSVKLPKTMWYMLRYTVPKTYQANEKSIFLSFLELFDKILELERNWNWSDFDFRSG